MRTRIKEADLSVPEQLDQYHYYSRTEAGRQYPILCRKQGSLEAVEEILLDQNLLAAAHTYFRVGVSAVSPDHKLLAYSVDTSGGEEFTLHIRDLTTGELLDETMSSTSLGVAWANDSRTRSIPYWIARGVPADCTGTSWAAARAPTNWSTSRLTNRSFWT
jgi:oligopeptidase B